MTVAKQVGPRVEVTSQAGRPPSSELVLREAKEGKLTKVLPEPRIRLKREPAHGPRFNLAPRVGPFDKLSVNLVTTVETFCFSLRNLPFGFLPQHVRGAFPP